MNVSCPRGECNGVLDRKDEILQDGTHNKVVYCLMCGWRIEKDMRLLDLGLETKPTDLGGRPVNLGPMVACKVIGCDREVAASRPTGYCDPCRNAINYRTRHRPSEAKQGRNRKLFEVEPGVWAKRNPEQEVCHG